jgi:non-specific serine/threonine protein kinase
LGCCKNKLLSIYGYSLDDNLTDKFEFTYQEGKPYLRVLDSSIKRIATPTTPEPRPRAAWEELPVDTKEQTEKLVEQPKKSELKLGVVITTNQQQYPFIQIEAIQGEPDDDFSKYTGKVEKIDLNKFVNTELFSEDDKMLLQQLRKLMPVEVSKYLTRNSPFSGIWDNIIQQHNDDLPEETKSLINEYLHPKFKKLFAELNGSNFVFTYPKKTFTTANLQHAEVSNEGVTPDFTINYLNNAYEIACGVKLPLAEMNVNENESETPLFFQYHNQFFTWQRIEDIMLVDQFLPTGKITIDARLWSSKLQEFILPLAKEYNVNFGNLKKK